MTLSVGEYRGERSEWDRFVRQQVGWTSFHLFGWARVIDRAFGHECCLLAATELGELRGVLPLVRVRSRWFGHFLVSMPFANYGGPLGSEDAASALAEHAVNLARDTEVDFLELRCRQQYPLDLTLSKRKITSVMERLPQGGEAVWKHLPTKMRTKIRKPMKAGLAFEHGAEHLDNFYLVWSENMRDLGTPALPRKFFEVIVSEFSDEVTVGCVYSGRRPVGAGFGFHWANEFEITWSSALARCRHLRASFFLHWKFIEYAAELGVERYNFGRSSPGSGTHQFKQQWGTTDQQLWWYNWARGAAAKTPSPTDAKYAWGPRIWRKLPLGLARLIGPRVVKFIP